MTSHVAPLRLTHAVNSSTPVIPEFTDIFGSYLFLNYISETFKHSVCKDKYQNSIFIIGVQAKWAKAVFVFIVMFSLIVSPT